MTDLHPLRLPRRPRRIDHIRQLPRRHTRRPPPPAPPPGPGHPATPPARRPAPRPRPRRRRDTSSPAPLSASMNASRAGRIPRIQRQIRRPRLPHRQHRGHHLHTPLQAQPHHPLRPRARARQHPRQPPRPPIQLPVTSATAPPHTTATASGHRRRPRRDQLCTPPAPGTGTAVSFHPASTCSRSAASSTCTARSGVAGSSSSTLTRLGRTGVQQRAHLRRVPRRDRVHGQPEPGPGIVDRDRQRIVGAVAAEQHPDTGQPAPASSWPGPGSGPGCGDSSGSR